MTQVLFKVCTRCRDEKPISAFSFARKKLRTRHSVCKSCASARAREDYRAKREYYFDLAKKRDMALDDLIISRKSRPCMDCGAQYPHYVMDFDHRDPRNKQWNISHMRRRRMAFSKITAEMDKCDVVCANCHRERTNRRNPSRFSKRQGNF